MLFAKLEDIWATTLTYEGGAEWTDYSYTEGGLPMADNAQSGAWKAFWKWAADRIKEPSTSAGAATALIGLLSEIPAGVLPPPWGLVVKTVITILGAVAMVRPENAGK